MGQIQNAAGSLAQTALGAAVAGKHLKQQQEQLAEAQKTKDLQGINAAVTTQSELNNVNTKAEEAAQAHEQHQSEYRENMLNWGNQVAYRDSGKHPNGQYNQKRLEMYKQAAMSSAAGLQADERIWDSLEAHYQALIDKKQAIKDIWGKDVIDVRGEATSRWERAKERHKALMESDKQPLVKDEKELIDKYGESAAVIHSRLGNAANDLDKKSKKEDSKKWGKK